MKRMMNVFFLQNIQRSSTLQIHDEENDSVLAIFFFNTYSSLKFYLQIYSLIFNEKSITLESVKLSFKFCYVSWIS